MIENVQKEAYAPLVGHLRIFRYSFHAQSHCISLGLVKLLHYSDCRWEFRARGPRMDQIRQWLECNIFQHLKKQAQASDGF